MSTHRPANGLVQGLKRHRTALSWLSGSILLACSQSAPEPPAIGGSGGGAAATSGVPASASGAGNGGTSGGAATGGTSVVLPSAGAGAASGGATTETCSASFAKTELQTVYLAFAFDVSGSMGKLDKPYHDPALKWEPVVRASKAFFSDPSSRGVRASLSFFPAEDDKCEAESYSQPAVAMTELPSAAFGSAIDAVTPKSSDEWRGGTPTLAVLKGTFAFLQAEANKDARGKYALVLITDGYPQGCDDDEDDIETVAAAIEAAAGTLPTYVIGVANPAGGPDTVTNLDRFAKAGGTQSAFLVATGDPERTADKLKETIDSIRGQSLSCAAAIPENPLGGALDPQKVNVTLSRAGTTSRLGYDETCSSERAWKFDDAVTPHSIVLCDTTCTALQQDSAAELSVEFGCERVDAAPR